jgi:hypothetical protein
MAFRAWGHGREGIDGKKKGKVGPVALPPHRRPNLQNEKSGVLSCYPNKSKEEIMPLIHVIVVLIVVGVLLWLVNSYIPMAGSIKTILNAVVVIVVVLWLLSVFGLIGELSSIRVGK